MSLTACVTQSWGKTQERLIRIQLVGLKREQNNKRKHTPHLWDCWVRFLTQGNLSCSCYKSERYERNQDEEWKNNNERCFEIVSHFVIKLDVVAQGTICSFLKETRKEDVYLNTSFFPFVSFRGHGILKKHSRNLGGAGSYQVIEATQGAEKTEVGTLLIHQSCYWGCPWKYLCCYKARGQQGKGIKWEVFILENRSIWLNGSSIESIVSVKLIACMPRTWARHFHTVSARGQWLVQRLSLVWYLHS